MPVTPQIHPVLGAVLRYWQAKRGARAMPSRREIDPVEMGANLLPHLVLSDLLDRGTRVRFRLVGTAVVKRMGFDPTAGYLGAEPMGGWADLLSALHRLVYAERAPIEAQSEFTWKPDRRLGVEQLLLPLSQDGSDPAIALAAFVFASADPFPPLLRALPPGAQHRELGRQVLRAQTSSASLRAGREVA
ncbi:MAG: PAS domain-containing protein [Stellaceae bacterium]